VHGQGEGSVCVPGRMMNLKARRMYAQVIAAIQLAEGDRLLPLAAGAQERRSGPVSAHRLPAVQAL
jgi:hypothetical protein